MKYRHFLIHITLCVCIYSIIHINPWVLCNDTVSSPSSTKSEQIEFQIAKDNPPDIIRVQDTLHLLKAGDFLRESHIFWYQIDQSILSYEDVALSSDRKLVYITNYNRIIDVDISNPSSPALNPKPINIHDNGSNLRFFPNAQKVFYLKDEKTVAIMSMSNTVDIITLNSAKKLYPPNSGRTHIAFRPDNESGFFCFEGNQSSGLHYFDSSSSEIIRLLELSDIPKSMKLSKDGKTLFIALNSIDKDPAAYSSLLMIYDVSNPLSPVFLNDFDFDFGTNSGINSITLTSNDKILFGLGRSNNKGFIQAINVSDISGLTSLSKRDLTETSEVFSNLLLSPNDDTLFVLDRIQRKSLVVDVSDPTNITTIYISAKLDGISGMTIIPETGLILARSNDNFITARPYINCKIQNNRFHHESLDKITIEQNFTANISSFSLNNTFSAIVEDGLTIFQIASDQKSLTTLRSIPINEILISTEMSRDGAIVCVITDKRLLIIDALQMKSVGQIEFDDSAVKPTTVTILPNSKTLIYLDSELRIVDVSNVNSIHQPTSFGYKPDMFVTNGKVLLVSSNSTLRNYDISDIHSPTLKYEKSFDATVSSLTISADGKTAVLGLKHCSDILSLTLYNLKDLTRYSELDSLDLDETTVVTSILLTEQNALFLQVSDKVSIIDVSTEKGLAFVGTLPVNVSHISVPPLNQGLFPLYIIDPYHNMHLITIKERYIMYLDRSDFGLGMQEAHHLAVLKENSAGKYSGLTEGYKITKILFFDTSYVPNSINSTIAYKPLPDWIYPDQMNNDLFIGPISPEAIGSYNIYSAVSTQLSSLDFSDISIDYPTLMLNLLTLQYIDDTGYLTDKFASCRDLKLPYDSATRISIHNILMKHYFEMITPIWINPSLTLNLSSETHIEINTPSQFALTVIISLDISSDPERRDQDCKFLKNIDSIIAPSIDPDSSVLTLEGHLFEINSALTEIIINQTNKVSPCRGNISVEDGMNNKLQQNNISLYFKQNPEISMDKDAIQKALDDSNVYTNYYLSILLDRSMFTGENLEFTLTNHNDSYWLAINNLSLSGTPLEPFLNHPWPATYHFTLNISNEFKYMTEDFSLTVWPSLGSVAKFFTGVATIIGLYIYYYKIRNTIFRYWYQHPDKFYIEVDENIKDQNIHPILFIAEELALGEALIKELKEYVHEECSQSSLTTKQFKDNLSNKIEEISKNISNKITGKMLEDIQAVPFRKELLNYIVLNKIEMQKLDLDGEKLTKKAFNRLQKRWTRIAQKHKTVDWQFSINETNLTSELEKENENESKKQIPLTKKNKSTESFIENEKAIEINHDLLSRALEAHAFRKYHLNHKVQDVTILAREKIKSFVLKRPIEWLTKKDLKLVRPDHNANLGYGLNYEITENLLTFTGVPPKTMKDKTIVIQIKNRGGKIVKELWLVGKATTHSSSNRVEIL